MVAVVDKPIRHTHREFQGRIHYYEVFDGEEEGRVPHFHGIVCASILAGETVGVAPGATTHYFAAPDAGENFNYESHRRPGGRWAAGDRPGGVYRGRQGAAGQIDVRRG